MRWREIIVSVVVMALVCVSGAAQSTLTMTLEAPPPPPIGMIGGVVGGGPLLGAKGQPYSLVEQTTQVRTLSDGTTMRTHREQHRMRDSEGRTRTEFGTVKDGQFVVQNVSVMDPVSGTIATMFLNGKTAIVTHYPQPKPPTPEQEARAAEFRAKAEEYRKEHPALPSGYEDLQGERIAGVYATGRRHTLIISAGREGNDRDIHVVEDTWTSPDLKIRMRSITDDPRMGKLTMEVTQLDRNEPDPALFQIPADYKVTTRGQ
ncbi:MAG TPA: hypothetical protein VGU25_01040 [Acidobacteriaceae bacterium]|nr:hypothetical protein [Acidobacteriaceae bacterium]